MFIFIKKLINKKYFSVKAKFDLVFKKIFYFILGGKHF